MYLDYFGLKEKPFTLTPDTKYLFLTKEYESAMGTLRYAVKDRMGFFVLTGEVGTGKTLLTRALLSEIDNSVETSLLVNPLMSVPELLQGINRDFGIKQKALSVQKQIDALNKLLMELHLAGRTALVIIDEAQNLSLEALEMIRMLCNMETEKSKLLQILLVGQPELDRKLNTYSLRQLKQRVVARCALRPLTLSEMVRYINHRLYLASDGQCRVYLEPDAYKPMYAATKGIPRLINIICDRALIAAYVSESPMLSGAIVRKAIRDVDIVTPRAGLGGLWSSVKRMVWNG